MEDKSFGLKCLRALSVFVMIVILVVFFGEVIFAEMDESAPETTIISPSRGQSFAEGFWIDSESVDSESGLAFCEYQIKVGGTGNWIAVSDYVNFTCSAPIWVAVGSNREGCNIQGEDICKINIRAYDNAGNREYPKQFDVSIDWDSESKFIVTQESYDNDQKFDLIFSFYNPEKLNIIGYSLIYSFNSSLVEPISQKIAKDGIFKKFPNRIDLVGIYDEKVTVSSALIGVTQNYSGEGILGVISFKRLTNDTIDFIAKKEGVGVTLSNLDYISFEKDITIPALSILTDESCVPMWVAQPFTSCVNFEKKSYFNDENNCGYSAPSPKVESCQVVEKVTSSVNLAQQTSNTISGNLVLRGEIKQLDHFTSGKLTNVNISSEKKIGNRGVIIRQAVQVGAMNLKSDLVSDVNVDIPDNTVILAPDGWNGIINSPKRIGVSGKAPSGFSVGKEVIEIGSDTETLIFDTPVTIQLEGVTGSVGYKPSGSDSWTKIEHYCGGTYDNPVLDALFFPGECYTSDGINTKILTFHFTSFGSLTPVSADKPAKQRSLGGTGTCSTQWSCGSWSACSLDGTQTRTCSYPQGFCAPIGIKPSESQSCMFDSSDQTLELESTNPSRFGITGAVIGAFGSGWTWAVLLVVLGMGVVVVQIKKKK